jgi:dUTP pyrophosphatase
MQLAFKFLIPEAVLPVYSTAGAAGMDVISAEDVIIQPGARAIISTGLSVAVPEGYELQCRPRSGLAANSGITVLNAPGTIDSDYRGEIKVILINHNWTAFEVNEGDRIAQLVLAPVTRAIPVEVFQLETTARGEGGFGSTGR